LQRSASNYSTTAAARSKQRKASDSDSDSRQRRPIDTVLGQGCKLWHKQHKHKLAQASTGKQSRRAIMPIKKVCGFF
jgi:hypothetical protein